MKQEKNLPRLYRLLLPQHFTVLVIYVRHVVITNYDGIVKQYHSYFHTKSKLARYIERDRETVPYPGQRILRSRVLDPRSRDPRSPAHPCTTDLQNMPEKHKNGFFRKYEYECMYSTIFNILTPLVIINIILSDSSKKFGRYS